MGALTSGQEEVKGIGRLIKPMLRTLEYIDLLFIAFFSISARQLQKGLSREGEPFTNFTLARIFGVVGCLLLVCSNYNFLVASWLSVLISAAIIVAFLVFGHLCLRWIEQRTFEAVVLEARPNPLLADEESFLIRYICYVVVANLLIYYYEIPAALSSLSFKLGAVGMIFLFVVPVIASATPVKDYLYVDIDSVTFDD